MAVSLLVFLKQRASHWRPFCWKHSVFTLRFSYFIGFYSAFQMMPKTRKNRTVKPFLAIQCGFFHGGDGEIWTLAPVSRPTPLAGEPRHHLSTSPWQRCNLFLLHPENPKLAEKVGFEPTEHCCSTVFKTASLNHSDTSPTWWKHASRFKNA